MEIFGPADFREQPWKNGGGVTRELLRAPHPLDPERFAWRVSCATVAASGPFSVFPGIDRSLMLLDGDGVALRCGDAAESRLTERGQVWDFSGDMATHCRLLGGPVRDFNLMVDRSLYRGKLSLIRSGDGPGLIAGAPLCLLYLLTGSIALFDSDQKHPCLLNAGELGRFRAGEIFSVQSVSMDALAVRVDLHRVTLEHVGAGNPV